MKDTKISRLWNNRFFQVYKFHSTITIMIMGIYFKVCFKPCEKTKGGCNNPFLTVRNGIFDADKTYIRINGYKSVTGKEVNG